MIKVSWIHLLILTLASFRFTRLVMYDEITSFIRAPFLTMTTDYDDNMEITHNIEIKGTGIRHRNGSYYCLVTGVQVYGLPLLLSFFTATSL